MFPTVSRITEISLRNKKDFAIIRWKICCEDVSRLSVTVAWKFELASYRVVAWVEANVSAREDVAFQSFDLVSPTDIIA